MDVKYIGGDEPWTLPFGDHFYSASQTSITSSHVDSKSIKFDLFRRPVMIVNRFRWGFTDDCPSIRFSRIICIRISAITDQNTISGSQYKMDECWCFLHWSFNRTRLSICSINRYKEIINGDRSILNAFHLDYHDDHGHTFCYLCSINAHDHPRTRPRPLSQVIDFCFYYVLFLCMIYDWSIYLLETKTDCVRKSKSVETTSCISRSFSNTRLHW